MNLYTKTPKYDIRNGKQFRPLLARIFMIDKISRDPLLSGRGRHNLML